MKHVAVVCLQTIYPSKTVWKFVKNVQNGVETFNYLEKDDEPSPGPPKKNDYQGNAALKLLTLAVLLQQFISC